jgi:3-deoxy-D-manno-octulosonic-acid transferase
MLRLYNTLLLPLRLAAAAWAWRRRGPSERGIEAAQRLARELPEVEPGGVWIHGSSVGEARLVRALSGAVRQRDRAIPVAASAFTRTGRAQLPEPPEVDAAFFPPLDFSGLPRRLLDALRPRALAVVETELWPNLLHEAFAAGVAVVVINGRLSIGRMGRYRRFSGLYRPLLAGLARVGAQSRDDADRFAELGVPEGAIEVTGNVKYDLPAPEVDEAALRGELGLPAGRPVFVAGSTGAGEDPLVLDAFLEARSVRPELFLVLAPRHPERCADVESEIRSRELRVARSSAASGEPGRRSDVLLVDTLGQLGRLYKLGVAAFVGGSLVPVGGHNVLEPAALGVPVLFGPHTENFTEPADALLSESGGLRVRDAGELARALGDLLGNPERREEIARAAARVVARNRGALRRNVDLLFSVLETVPAAPSGETK